MFNLIPDNWGGHIGPWAREITRGFDCLKALHFRRMIVTDGDLQMLATNMGRVLQVFKLDKCSGFSSTDLSMSPDSARI
ncbi:hypothetical protein MLD38_008706 [Melastoma candidum]|uniref:Uncharacterized protein n=1 Tax=Melastoma candidum TaxID=119954 RepID=A0ACB9RY99_9MYRT|nr:hypothetical protein MLD38_008706 [Melastoma candidum]